VRGGKWPDATTAVVAVVDPVSFAVAWAGDSVALLFDGKTCELLTTAHLATNALEAKRIVEAGGRIGRSEAEANASTTRKLVGKLAPSSAFGTSKKHPKRVYPGGIKITRVLGGLPLKASKVKLVIADVEVVQRKRSSKDKMLILASDGLLERLTLEAIASVLISEPTDPALALVETACANRTKDDVCVVCMAFNP